MSFKQRMKQAYHEGKLDFLNADTTSVPEASSHATAKISMPPLIVENSALNGQVNAAQVARKTASLGVIAQIYNVAEVTTINHNTTTRPVEMRRKPGRPRSSESESEKKTRRSERSRKNNTEWKVHIGNKIESMQKNSSSNLGMIQELQRKNRRLEEQLANLEKRLEINEFKFNQLITGRPVINFLQVLPK